MCTSNGSSGREAVSSVVSKATLKVRVGDAKKKRKKITVRNKYVEYFKIEQQKRKEQGQEQHVAVYYGEKRSSSRREIS